jgi:uncharacterized protein YndB with AHSA1/START domain
MKFYILQNIEKSIMSKVKYQLEYVINTAPKLLYARLTTPSGLSEWFADDVHVKGQNFIFIWNKIEQEAKVLSKKANEFVRYKWLDDDDDDDDNYFEFLIAKEELTGDVALIITDFTEEENLSGSRELWDNQIAILKRAIGV